MKSDFEKFSAIVLDAFSEFRSDFIEYRSEDTSAANCAEAIGADFNNDTVAQRNRVAADLLHHL